MRTAAALAACVLGLAVLAATAARGVSAAPEPAPAPCANPLVGAGGADTLRGSAASDRLTGLGGPDLLAGEAGDDCLDGGTGDDVLRGGDGDDALSGGSGDDALSGGADDDRIVEASDEYRPGERFDSGSNRIDAGPGRDVVDAANGRPDRVACGTGRDRALVDASDTVRDCERRRRLASPLPAADPGAGGMRRSFMISFRAVSAVRPPRAFFSIEVEGPRGSGCRRVIGNSVGVRYGSGDTVRYRLRPFRGSGRAARTWCRGRYTGSASYMRRVRAGCGIRPSAAPRPSCVEEAPIGEFSFRVR